MPRLGLALVFAVCGCATTPHPATSPVSAEERVVRDFVAAFNSGDVDKMVTLVAPEMVWLDVKDDSVSINTQGSEAMAKGMRDYFASVKSPRSELEAVVVNGRFVSFRERAHWEGKSGPRSQSALGVYEIEGGKIRRVWYFPATR